MSNEVDRGGETTRASTGEGAGPTTRLKTRWRRRLAALAIVLATAGPVFFATTQTLVLGFRDAAERIENDASRSSRLRADIADHTNAGHSFIEGNSEAGARLGALEASIREGFASSAAGAANGAEERLLRKAEGLWERGLATIVPNGPAQGGRTAAHVSLAGTSIEAAATIDEAASVGRAGERAVLARSERAARYAMAAMGLAAALVVASFIRLGRKLRLEILDPVARLRDSAARWGAGELDHRAEVERADELGELAASFNAMAGAIAGTHRALAREARHDSLTGLANRAAFRSRIEAALAGPQRRAGSQAVVFVDLDDFKDVNDTLGHAAGDEVLTVVADRLRGAVRPGDVAARLGGDEFAIFLDGPPDPGAARTVAERVVAAIAERIELSGVTVRIGASAGVAERDEFADAEELMRRADVAMYLAKGRGKNRVEHYDPGVDEAAAAHNQLKAEVAAAAGRGELFVEYQPIVDLPTGTVTAVEALVRWDHPTRGRVAPLDFIPVAEETGAIVGIGAWVLETSLTQLRAWQDAHGLPSLAVSVNVSPRQLDAPGFAEVVAAALGRAGVDPGCLVVEVTESALVDPAGSSATTLAALRGLGVRIALDDFGTGYSSLGYLRQLPVDLVKIDRSFVSGAAATENGDALLEAIVALGQRLDLEVIPEGVETDDQLARLRDLGCLKAQGFLLSRPIPAPAVDALLAAATPLVGHELGSAPHLAPLTSRGLSLRS